MRASGVEPPKSQPSEDCCFASLHMPALVGFLTRPSDFSCRQRVLEVKPLKPRSSSIIRLTARLNCYCRIMIHSFTFSQFLYTADLSINNNNSLLPPQLIKKHGESFTPDNTNFPQDTSILLTAITFNRTFKTLRESAVHTHSMPTRMGVEPTRYLIRNSFYVGDRNRTCMNCFGWV